MSEYVGSSEEWMLNEAAKFLKVGENKDDYQKRHERERKERLQAKRVHGRFLEDAVVAMVKGGIPDPEHQQLYLWC